MATKSQRNKPAGEKDKPKDPTKSKPVPDAKLTEIRSKSNGRYKNNNELRAVIGSIECTEELAGQFLADRGIRV